MKEVSMQRLIGGISGGNGANGFISPVYEYKKQLDDFENAENAACDFTINGQTGEWTISFLESGYLKFYNLDKVIGEGEDAKLDIFCVGGGGGGANGFRYDQKGFKITDYIIKKGAVATTGNGATGRKPVHCGGGGGGGGYTGQFKTQLASDTYYHIVIGEGGKGAGTTGLMQDYGGVPATATNGGNGMPTYWQQVDSSNTSIMSQLKSSIDNVPIYVEGGKGGRCTTQVYKAGSVTAAQSDQLYFPYAKAGTIVYDCYGGDGGSGGGSGGWGEYTGYGGDGYYPKNNNYVAVSLSSDGGSNGSNGGIGLSYSKTGSNGQGTSTKCTFMRNKQYGGGGGGSVCSTKLKSGRGGDGGGGDGGTYPKAIIEIDGSKYIGTGSSESDPIMKKDNSGIDVDFTYKNILSRLKWDTSGKGENGQINTGGGGGAGVWKSVFSSVAGDVAIPKTKYWYKNNKGKIVNKTLGAISMTAQTTTWALSDTSFGGGDGGSGISILHGTSILTIQGQYNQQNIDGDGE